MDKWARLITTAFLLLSALLVDASSQTLKRPESFGDSEFKLGPEDVIDIFVWKEEDLTVSTVIRPDGKIAMKLIGEIVASRKTASELEGEIRTKLLKYLNDPRVTVIVKEINSPKVSVFGEVKKPDIYKIKQKTTILGAIALAGGFTEFAKRDKVVVIRDDIGGSGDSKKFTLNLKAMLGKKTDAAFYIQPGDMVYVQ